MAQINSAGITALSRITFTPAPASRIMWACDQCKYVGLHRRKGSARIRLTEVIEAVLNHECETD